MLQRDFKHAAVDMYLTEELVEEKSVKKLVVAKNYGKSKQLAVIRSITSHVQVRAAASVVAVLRRCQQCLV